MMYSPSQTPSSRSMRLCAALLLALLLLSLTPLPALAQTPVRTPAFVYALSAFDGQVWQSTFAPPSVDTLYLIADSDNVLASRQTQIYYWALTNRYEADWMLKNDFVDGALEVLQGGRLVDSLHSVDYVVQYDANDAIATRRLATGAEGKTAYDAFKQKQSEYRDALYNYYKAQQEYRDQVDALLADATKNGKTLSPNDFPAAPAPVDPLSLFSTDLARGFVLHLPLGSYTVQLRLPDGTLQPGSVKKLVTFSKLQDGISYNVVPQSRWSMPEPSRPNGGVIYAPSGNTVYLQPFYQGLYNDAAYGHLLDPQDSTSRVDRNRWVSFGPAKNNLLEVTPQGVPPTRLKPVGYKVIQSAGSGLGYEVNPLEPNSTEKASFEGYQISISEAAPSYSVRLVDPQGNEWPGSRREVRLLYTVRAGWLYVFSAVPLLLGLGMLFARFKTVRKVKVEG
jgi:hypothetical protein